MQLTFGEGHYTVATYSLGPADKSREHLLNEI